MSQSLAFALIRFNAWNIQESQCKRQSTAVLAGHLPFQVAVIIRGFGQLRIRDALYLVRNRRFKGRTIQLPDEVWWDLHGIGVGHLVRLLQQRHHHPQQPLQWLGAKP